MHRTHRPTAALVRLTSLARLTALVCGCTLAAALSAGEGSPLMEIKVADGAQLVAHAKASIYGQLWNDPVMAKVRAEVDTKMAELKEDILVDPFVVLPQATGIRARFLGMTEKDGKPMPRIVVQADLGDQAATVLAAVRKHGKETTVAGADEAVLGPKGELVVARFKNVVVLSVGEAAPAPLPVGAAPLHDVTFDIAMARLIEAIEPAMVKLDTEGYLSLAKPLLAKLGSKNTGYFDLIATGVRDHSESDAQIPWLVAVDQAILARQGAGTLHATAVGIDGKLLWQDLAPHVLALVANGQKRDGTAPSAQQIELMGNLVLTTIGVTAPMSEVIGDLRGTILLSLGQSMPFPTITLSIPSGPALDQLITVGLKQVKLPIPEIGKSEILPIPNLPAVVTLIREAKRWTVTSDPSLASTWTTDQPGGFSGSPLAKLITPAGGAQACLVSVTDLPAIVRLIQAMAGFLLSDLSKAGIEPAQVAAAMAKFSRTAVPSWQIVVNDGKRLVSDGQWLTPYENGGALVPIIAAIAIPNLLEKRITANEPMAAATLRSGIFPAEVQFQAGTYVDADGNGVGEYGYLNELTGLRVTSQVGEHAEGSLQLLPKSMDNGGPNSSYRYAIFLPDGQGGALSEPDGNAKRPVVAAAARDQEKYFIAYAWPESRDQGRRMFAITQNGVVLSAPFDGTAPAWNAALEDGTTWKDQKFQWKPVRK